MSIKVNLISQYRNAKPEIKLTVQRVEPSVWITLGFYKHHYLTSSLNKSCKCLLFSWNSIPVAFVALLNSPRKGMPWGHSISRIVILPDFQGLGLSSKIINFCGGILKSNGDDWTLYLKTVHTKMGSYLENSPSWAPTAYNGKTRNERAINDEGKRYKNRLARKSYCYKYIGEPIFGYGELLEPINKLRNKKIMPNE